MRQIKQNHHKIIALKMNIKKSILHHYHSEAFRPHEQALLAFAYGRVSLSSVMACSIETICSDERRRAIVTDI